MALRSAKGTFDALSCPSSMAKTTRRRSASALSGLTAMADCTGSRFKGTNEYEMKDELFANPRKMAPRMSPSGWACIGHELCSTSCSRCPRHPYQWTVPMPPGLSPPCRLKPPVHEAPALCGQKTCHAADPTATRGLPQRELGDSHVPANAPAPCWMSTRSLQVTVGPQEVNQRGKPVWWQLRLV